MKVKADSTVASMKFLANKYDTLLNEVSNLVEENKGLKSQLVSIKTQEVRSKFHSNTIK